MAQATTFKTEGRLDQEQRQKLIRVLMYGVFVVGVALFVIFADWDAIATNFFNLEIAGSMFPEVVTIAAKNTLLYTVLSFLFGLVLGLVLALMKMSTVGPYRWLATTYVEIFRGLPALLTLFLIGFGIPLAFGTNWSILWSGVLALGLVAAAYMAETIRAGIQAVPKGQMEAARSLGMSQFWAMTSIVIPQAFRIIVPPMTNEFVLLIKDTSLFFVLGFTPANKELTKFGRDILSTRANATPLIVAGIMYLVVTIPLTRLVAALERRQARAR
ncbi:MAG: amino acid ABC transporter permease [Nitriliruptorales bacterium]|nr:amino acid ABC transporter permease [Nitriliruptorales bacterium]